jgi:hypothetical protein
MLTSEDLKMFETFDNQIRTGGNTGLAKVAVQCSSDTFVVNQSLILLPKIYGKNRQLIVASKTYGQA